MNILYKILAFDAQPILSRDQTSITEVQLTLNDCSRLGLSMLGS